MTPAAPLHWFLGMGEQTMDRQDLTPLLRGRQSATARGALALQGMARGRGRTCRKSWSVWMGFLPQVSGRERKHLKKEMACIDRAVQAMA